MWEGAQRGAPSAIQEGTCGLREQCKSLVWGFIGFLHKPRNISLFLSSIFLTATFFLSLSISIYFSHHTVTLRIPWIQLGLDPGITPCSTPTILEPLAHADTITANHNSPGEQQKIKPSLKTKTFGQIQTYSIGNAIRNLKCLAFTVPFKSKFLLLPLSLSTFTYPIPP